MIQVVREIHSPPAEIARRLVTAGGLNRFGAPNYRVVWGWARLEWIGGRIAECDKDGIVLSERWTMQREPKYWKTVNPNRWILEKWLPPESYGPPWIWSNVRVDEEGTMEQQLGPYPQFGDYELSWVCETPTGQFLQLTPHIANALVLRIERSRGNAQTVSRKRAKADEAVQAYKNWAFEMMADTPEWVATPHVYQSN